MQALGPLSEQLLCNLQLWLGRQAAVPWNLSWVFQMGAYAAALTTAALALSSLLALWRFILFGAS